MMQPNPPFQFGLISLLAAITVIAVLLALFNWIVAIFFALVGVSGVYSWRSRCFGPIIVACVAVIAVIGHMLLFHGAGIEEVFILAFFAVSIAAMYAIVRTVKMGIIGPCLIVSSVPLAVIGIVFHIFVECEPCQVFGRTLLFSAPCALVLGAAWIALRAFGIVRTRPSVNRSLRPVSQPASNELGFVSKPLFHCNEDFGK